MKRPGQSGSMYLSPSDRLSTRKTAGPSRFLFFLSSLLALAFLFSSLSYIAVEPLSAPALAGESGDPQLGFDEATEGQDSDQEGFEDQILKLEEDDIEDQTKSLSYALFRQFTIRYMNEAPEAVVPSDLTDPRVGGIYNCDAGAKGAGTLMYHNCDVPNLLTEFVQDVGDVFLPTGALDAEQETAYVGSSWWGLSSNTPEKVDVNSGIKYTAMELYGYNMKYTSYKGEWDHVKVMTAARALSNFGLLDNLKLGVSSIVNGITAGLDSSLEGLIDDLSSGSVAQLATAPFHAVTNFFKGATAAGINTIMDTSETNVFATNAWYRPGFSSTMYGARELSEAETAQVLQQSLLDVITASLPENAQPPDDLKSMEKPPRPAGPQCSVTLRNTATRDEFNQEHPDPATMTSRQLCATWANQYSDSTNRIVSVDYAPADNLANWGSTAGWQAVATKYDISCSVNPAGDFQQEMSKFYACWAPAWADAMEKELKAAQQSVNSDWWEKTTLADNIRKGMEGSKNFNDPRSRYVCTDKQSGDDLLAGDAYIYLFNGDGSLNNQCQLPVRAPIQDGLFGNGYRAAQDSPVTDPRRSQFAPTIFDIIPGPNFISSSVSDFGLTISKSTTRISNTVLNLSFSPILETLGINKIIAEMIKGFRDSIFYPLAILFVAIGALTIFFSALKERTYTKQLTNAGLLCLTFIFGSILMENPEQVISVVDEAPAAVENVIVGSIFEVGNPDANQVCTATPEPSANGRDFAGSVLPFDPAASSRTLLCENWRTFLFTPYVYGQWGASYDDLEADAMENTNGELVGDATVNMGRAGQTESNWALYQLDSTLTGTTTTQDPSNPAGHVDPNFYKIVDLQAHPDVNGVGAPDGRYLENWSGDNGSQRAGVALMGAALSILGMVTIIVYAFAKITVSLMVTLMLLFIPFMFLVGLHPTQGRMKLKAYFAQIVSLMIQRIMLVTMIALMMKILVAMSTATTSFFLFFILSFATCIAFLSYRKEVIGLFSQSVTDKYGSFGSGDQEGSGSGRMLPKSLGNWVKLQQAAVTGGATGYVGGFVVGGREGARGAAVSEARRAQTKTGRRQIRGGGQGALQNAFQGAESGQKEAQSNIGPKVDAVKADLRTELSQPRYTEDRSEAAQAEERRIREEMLSDIGPKTAKEHRDYSRAARAQDEQVREVKGADVRSDAEVAERISDLGRAKETDVFEKMLDEVHKDASELTQRRTDAYNTHQSNVDESKANIKNRFEQNVEEKVKATDSYLDSRHREEDVKETLQKSSYELVDRMLWEPDEDGERQSE